MIISHSTLGKNGRLGNQMFQVASTLGLAVHYNAKASFPQWEYEQYFEVPLPHGELMPNTVSELYFHHYDWGLTESCNIMGFLQSEKYFPSIQPFKFKKEFVELQKKKYPIFDKETICIQIRRGDYVGNENYFQVPVTFYLHALLVHFPNWRDYNILVISDDIEYCKVHFGCLPNVTFTDGNRDIEDMALASACDHFIISNSSFGWWCAYLGEKSGSKIIHCGRLHSGRLKKKGNEDYYPYRWISHQAADDSYKIDLPDVTFTIPLFWDHPSRKANFDLVLCMLQMAFNSNFIVCEQGGRKFNYAHQWAKYVVFVGPEFHRTKMLNYMCSLAVTPYVINWDCDIIIPPIQVYLSVEELRRGGDMVYPYDGAFARMPRDPWFSLIEKALDIGIVKGTKFEGRSVDHGSVGGVVFWNKQSFIEGGMENENMISFGPEDVERYERFNTLGYDVRRVRGSLFHLNHFVGPNSSPRNPHFQSNLRELERIRAMTKQQLSEDVDNWSWCSKYTKEYYASISEGAIRSAKVVMDLLPSKIGSVLDVGCGVGEWNNGNPQYVGVDYKVDRTKLLIHPDDYIECNLNMDFPVLSGTPIPTKFDLVLCLEVAEHLKPSRAEPLVKYLCSMSNLVLFSAAIPFQGGTGHVNEQWQSYWADLFAKEGFGAAKKQPNIRKNSDVELWYRNNATLYERGGKGKVEDFILPEYYVQIVGGLKVSV